MLLSKPQKRILELIREFGGLKRNMLFELIGREPNLDVMLNQMKLIGKIKEIGDYLCDDTDKICKRDTETALEVMLAVTDEMPEYFVSGKPPFALTFFKMRQEKLCRYDICIVPDDKEIVVSAFLEGINTKYRIICLLVKDLSKRDMLNFPCEHIFITKENGGYHYYK